MDNVDMKWILKRNVEKVAIMVGMAFIGKFIFERGRSIAIDEAFARGFIKATEKINNQ